MYMNPRSRILGVAQEVGLAREQWNLCQETIHGAPELAPEFDRARNVNGDEMFWLTNKSRYAIKAASRKAGRGGSNDEVNFDELREQRDWRAWAAVSKTTMARPNSQIFLMSNAGDDESVVLNQLREAAITGRDPTIGIFEYSGAYDDQRYCDIDDWQELAQANPGLGYIINPAAIASAMTSDPAGVFRTEVLCQRVRHVDAALDMNAWADCADPAVTMDTLRQRLAVCFDVAPDGAHATLAVAARTQHGHIRGEIAASWNNFDQAWRELPDLLHRIRPCAAGWYPSGPSAAAAPIFRRPDGRIVDMDHARPGVPAYEALQGGAVVEACMGLAELVKARQIFHNNDPLLNDHAGNATRLNVGDGWRFARRDTETGHVDAVYAFAGAVRLALLLPERRRVRLLTA